MKINLDLKIEEVEPTQVRRRKVGQTTTGYKRRVLVNKKAALDAARATEQQEQQTSTASYEANFVSNDRQHVNLDAEQQAAVHMMMTEQYGVLIGGAGTGKTTTLNQALAALATRTPVMDWSAYQTMGAEPTPERLHRPAIACVALSSPAKANLQSKLDKEWTENCMTIHNLLKFAPVSAEDAVVEAKIGRDKLQMFAPRYTAELRLPHSVIIADETTLVNRDLWEQLLAAASDTCQIFLVGDMDQLQAMGGATPLPFAIGHWPTVELKTVYRQKKGGALIDGLTRIRANLPPKHHDLEFRCDKLERLPIAATKAREHIAKYITMLTKQGIWVPQRDMIITPENEAMLGQVTWNNMFRAVFNPPRHNEDGLLLNPQYLVQTALGVKTYTVGDKVMSLGNGGRGANEKRFSNGAIGIITKIEPNPSFGGSMQGLGEQAADEGLAARTDMMLELDLLGGGAEHGEELIDEAAVLSDNEPDSRQASHIITVLEIATGDEHTLTRSAEVTQMQHAYATTAHKFQGSQAARVLVICHGSMNFGLHTEWLYTACSRAQSTVFLMHTTEALNSAVRRQQVAGNGAREKAETMKRLYEGRKWARPSMPEPRKINSKGNKS